jgi:hypothetical protein
MAALRKPSLFLIFVLLLLGVPGHASQTRYGDQPVLWEFFDYVNHYAALQHMAITSLGPPVQWSDAEQVLRQQRRYADAMREMHPGACASGFFTPRVAGYFRTRIDQIVRDTGLDVTTAIEAPDEGEQLITAPPCAGENVPWNAGPVMWPSMLAGLPELPGELEYRFLGRDLLIVDVLANLVVDVLHDALPEPESVSS